MNKYWVYYKIPKTGAYGQKYDSLRHLPVPHI